MRPRRRTGTILPRLLGLLFLTMAGGQLRDLPAFRAILATYEFASPDVLSVLLQSGELLAGAWLLFAPRRRPIVPAAVFTATSLLWALLATQAFVRGLTVPNCGCFGTYLAQPLRWWVLLQDALLLLYSGLLLRRARAGRHRLPLPR